MKRLVLSALAVMAALLAAPGVATGDVRDEASRPVPRVPLVIDGKWLAPKEISRFDGKPLYLFFGQGNADVLVGFTDETKANAYLSNTRTFAPSTAGQYTVVYSEDEVRGDAQTINSGTSYNNLAAVPRGCGLFGCAGNWDNVISSILMNGTATFYTDPNFGGGWLHAWGGNWWFNVSTIGAGWDNQISSLHVHW